MDLEVKVTIRIGQGSSLNHVDRFLVFFTPLPHMYLIIWTFGKTLPPAMSTWFMNDP